MKSVTKKMAGNVNFSQARSDLRPRRLLLAVLVFNGKNTPECDFDTPAQESAAAVEISAVAPSGADDRQAHCACAAGGDHGSA